MKRGGACLASDARNQTCQLNLCGDLLNPRTQVASHALLKLYFWRVYQIDPGVLQLRPSPQQAWVCPRSSIVISK